MKIPLCRMSQSDHRFVSRQHAAAMESIMRRPTNSAFLKPAALALALTFAVAPIAYAHKLGNFDAADANHDGCVSQQEFVTYETQRLMAKNGPLAQKFKQLTPQEQTARLQARFEKLDVGNKGCLDQNEWNGS
jgi:hypothetical protein